MPRWNVSSSARKPALMPARLLSAPASLPQVAGVMVLPAGTNEFSSSDRLEVVVPAMFDRG